MITRNTKICKLKSGEDVVIAYISKIKNEYEKNKEKVPYAFEDYEQFEEFMIVGLKEVYEKAIVWIVYDNDGTDSDT